MVLAEWGEQRGSGDYCRWGVVGSRTFPLIKKETMNLGIPNLWISWKITRISPQEKHLLVKGNFRSVCLDEEKATKAPISQWCQNFPILLQSTLFQHGQGMKIQRGRQKEPCRNGHICTSWSVPWASAGERETLNRLNMRWSWHLTDLDLGNPEWWNAWNGYKVMQEMRMQWRVGDDSPWGGWARSPLYLVWSQPLCFPRNFIWWNPDSHGYGIYRWGLCEVMEL